MPAPQRWPIRLTLGTMNEVKRTRIRGVVQVGIL
jgi:hypothetical protein